MIKLLDINRQDKKIRKLILKDFNNIINKGSYILGKEVSLFEKEFAKFCKSKFAIGVGNGTDALLLALKSLNLKKNSEIILPAMTWKSTLLCVLNLNLKPILVDIKSDSSNFDLLLKEFWRILKPEGQIIIIYSSRLGSWIKNMGPFSEEKSFSRKKFKKSIIKSGFQITFFTGCIYFPYRKVSRKNVYHSPFL